MSEKVKNTIIVLEPMAKSVAGLLSLIEEKQNADIVKVATPDEALQQIVGDLPCMLLASINDNNEVPTRVQLFKRLEGAIKNHGLKVYVVTPLKNRQLADMVTQKMGVADYITEPVPARTMMFKANLQLKAIDNFRRQQELKKQGDEKIVIKKLEGKKPEATPAGNDLKPKGKPAVQAGEDTFLFKNSAAKKAGKKFTVELEGPDPSTGEWVPHEDKGDAQSAWRWVANEEKEQQAKGETPPDGWVHSGDKPVFNENTKKWAMTSEKPSLELRQKNKVLAKKVGLDDDGEVFVAEDSAAAEENLKKNRAKALLARAKEAETRGLKSLKKDDGKEPKSEKDATETEGEADPPAPKELRQKSRIKIKDGKIKSLLEEDEEEEGPSASDLKDRRNKEENGEDGTLELKQRPTLAKKFSEEGEPKRIEGEEAPDGLMPLKALDILQKKKEARDLKNKLASEAGEETEEEGSETAGEEEGLPGMRALKKSRKKGDLKDRLGKLLESEEEPEREDLLGKKEKAEESGAGPAGRSSLKLAEREAREKVAKALRDDPADKRGELNDHQGESQERRSAELRRKKSRAIKEIQELVQSPLPEELDPDEEEKLRDELGFKNRPEIKAKELVRKKRLKRAKELKDRLDSLDLEIEKAEKGEALSGGGIREVDPETPRRQGDLTPEKLKGIRNALDDADEIDNEIEEARKRVQAAKEERKQRAAAQDRAQYMPEADLLPLGNAWESAETHYVYLDAKVRYKGFEKIEDLLPLWVFEGEDIPVLLDKTKQWRFIGGLPVLRKTVSEVPRPVRDFLIGVRDQIRKKSGEENAPQVESEDRARREEEAPGELRRQEKAEAKEEISREEPKEPSRAELEVPRMPRSRIAEALGEDEDKDESSGKEEKSSRLEAPREELAEDTRAEENTSDGGFSRPKRERKEEASSPEDLRERLDEGAGENREDLTACTERQEAAAGAKTSPAAEIPAALKDSKSEGVKSFLERRKAKKAETAAEPAKKLAPTTQSPPPGFLGLYLAMSDAYASTNSGSAAASLSRILASIEGSFKDCTVVITLPPDAEGNAAIKFTSTHGSVTGEKVVLSEGLSAPIKTKDGEDGDLLGYLYLRSTGARSSFDEAEQAAFRRTAGGIWALLLLADDQGKAA